MLFLLLSQENVLSLLLSSLAHSQVTGTDIWCGLSVLYVCECLRWEREDNTEHASADRHSARERAVLPADPVRWRVRIPTSLSRLGKLDSLDYFSGVYCFESRWGSPGTLHTGTSVKAKQEWNLCRIQTSWILVQCCGCFWFEGKLSLSRDFSRSPWRACTQCAKQRAKRFPC